MLFADGIFFSIFSSSNSVDLKNSSFISFLIFVSHFLNSLSFNSLKSFPHSKKLFFIIRGLFFYIFLSILSQYVRFYNLINRMIHLYILFKNLFKNYRKILLQFLEKKSVKNIIFEVI